MPEKEWRNELITVKVPVLAHEALSILQKRYGSKRLGDALLQFLEEKGGDIVTDANKALGIKEQLDAIYDNTESKD